MPDATLHADEYFDLKAQDPDGIDAFDRWLERAIGRPFREHPPILAVTLGEGFVICDEVRHDDNGHPVVEGDFIATDPVTYRSATPPPCWPGLSRQRPHPSPPAPERNR